MPKKTVRGSTRSSSRCELVTIGASAGGLGALSQVLAGLGADFPPILIVQHLYPSHKSHLAGLLARKTRKTVKEAQDGELLSRNTVYIGPPDEHLLVSRGRVQLAHSRLIRFSRPSIDMMFGAVAATYGDRCIGVILSGSNRDGSDGIAAIKRAGGITIAQEPATAEYRIMPQAAIETGCVDLIVPLEKLGKTISALLEQKGKK